MLDIVFQIIERMKKAIIAFDNLLATERATTDYAKNQSKRWSLVVVLGCIILLWIGTMIDGSPAHPNSLHSLEQIKFVLHCVAPLCFWDAATANTICSLEYNTMKRHEREKRRGKSVRCRKYPAFLVGAVRIETKWILYILSRHAFKLYEHQLGYGQCRSRHSQRSERKKEGWKQ